MVSPCSVAHQTLPLISTQLWQGLYYVYNDLPNASHCRMILQMLVLITGLTWGNTDYNTVRACTMCILTYLWLILVIWLTRVCCLLHDSPEVILLTKLPRPYYVYTDLPMANPCHMTHQCLLLIAWLTWGNTAYNTIRACIMCILTYLWLILVIWLTSDCCLLQDSPEVVLLTTLSGHVLCV